MACTYLNPTDAILDFKVRRATQCWNHGTLLPAITDLQQTSINAGASTWRVLSMTTWRGVKPQRLPSIPNQWREQSVNAFSRSMCLRCQWYRKHSAQMFRNSQDRNGPVQQGKEAFRLSLQKPLSMNQIFPTSRPFIYWNPFTSWEKRLEQAWRLARSHWQGIEWHSWKWHMGLQRGCC